MNGVPESLGSVEGAVYDLVLDGNDVYATGYEITSGSDRIARVWKNGVPQTLPAATSYASGEQIAVSNGKVYVLGYETFMYQTALWIDGVKQTGQLPEHPYNSGNQNVGLWVAGNDVYTCGVAKNPAGMYKIMLLKNGGRMAVDTLANKESGAERLFVSGADVYLMGYEHDGSASADNSRLWKNGLKQNLANVPADYSGVDLFVEGSDVYVTGVDKSIPGFKNQLITWKSGSISQRIKMDGLSLNASDMKVSKGNVYIAGQRESTPQDIGMLWVNGSGQALTDGSKSFSVSSVAVRN